MLRNQVSSFMKTLTIDLTWLTFDIYRQRSSCFTLYIYMFNFVRLLLYSPLKYTKEPQGNVCIGHTWESFYQHF